MCGISGVLRGKADIDDGELDALIRRMTDTLHHRGPDDFGYFCDMNSGVALGHRRLSIIDLSQEGHQPMHSASGRYVLSYNGEIYNFPALRKSLEDIGTKFRGHSDTEVLLGAVESWGLFEALKRSNGMFALALWDREDKVLTLARDRAGKKPLYYSLAGGACSFASELKALRLLPFFDSTIDRQSLALLLRYGYIPDPKTIYARVSRLNPGEILSVPLELLLRGYAQRDMARTSRRFWSVSDVIRDGRTNPWKGSFEEAKTELEQTLKEAVRLRMVSDVPLGALLSGGIDSTAVTLLMQRQSDRPVTTFSIGFREEEYDEAAYAREIAAYLGTDHHELYVTPAEARDVIPKLSSMYDEPFGDVSSIPTFLVARLARQHVTVALSGDGGDELFGGYSRYQLAARVWQWAKSLPLSLRRGLEALVCSAPSPLVERALGLASSLSGQPLRGPGAVKKLQRGMAFLAGTDPMSVYNSVSSHWLDAEAVVTDAAPPWLTPDRECSQLSLQPVEQFMCSDFAMYLPGDILTKVDRASMAVGLEARSPLLDPNVIALAWRFSVELKTAASVGKRILREVLYEHVPRRLLERPKQGFAVPIDQWLRGPLRGWAEDLLDEKRLRSEGYFRARGIRQKWTEHLQEQGNWQYLLWDVLMFQSWKQEHDTGN